MKSTHSRTKKILIVLTLGTIALAFTPGASLGEGEAREKIEKTGEKAKHKAKKSAHRVEEAACTDSDLECEAKKAGNRVDETTAKAKDKVD